MTKCYRISGWDLHYEKNHKDTEVAFRWVGFPTKHDGKSYRRIARHRKCCLIFTAFVLMVEEAAKMNPRGYLCDENGPLTAQDLSDSTGFPVECFEIAFKVLSSQEIGWIEECVSPNKSEQVLTSSELVPPTVQDSTEQNITGQNTPLPPKGEGVRFDSFWEEWPKHERKVNRAACLRFWKRNELDNIAEQVMLALRRCKVSHDWTKDDGQFIPMVTTWLNGRRWEAPIREPRPDPDAETNAKIDALYANMEQK